MAESRNERNPRAVSRPSRSRCAQYAVRGLVVAGLAGVAWLLSSSTAHAADEGDGAPAGSVTSLVADLDGGVSGQRGTAAVLTTATELLSPVLPDSAADYLSAGRGSVDGADGAEAHSTPPHAGQPGIVQDLLLPVGAALQPVSQSVAPLAATMRTLTTGVATASGRGKPGNRATVVAPAKGPALLGAPADDTAPPTVTPGAGVTMAGAATHRAVDRRDAGSTRPVSAVEDRLQRTHHVPLLPRPAPLPAAPAQNSPPGVPSAGSGLNLDGGASATVPAATVAATVTGTRPEAVEDVEVRLLAAESPTVSPD